MSLRNPLAFVAILLAVRGGWRDERIFEILWDEIANTHV